MSWDCIDLAQVAATPWRNGGGQTRELIAWPSSADWRWRISVAEVASDGAFSCFEGVQRWLAILAGAGVRLAFADRVVELGTHSTPLPFDGVEPVHCQLLDGPVQDLNLMLRDCGSSDGEAAMRRVSGAVRVSVRAATTAALFAVDSAAMLRSDGRQQTIARACLAWRVFTDAACVDIHAGNALWMTF